MEYKFKVLIIGLGNIGMGYDINIQDPSKTLTHTKSFYYHKNFEIIGGIDKNIKKCQQFFDTYKIKCFTKLNLSIIKKNPEIIVISVPSNKTLDVLKEVINNISPKIILLEKPIYTNYKEIKEIIKDGERKNIKFFVNYMRLSDKNVYFVKEEILNWKTQLKGTAFYSKGLYNGASHFINLLNLWLGKIVKLRILKKGKFFNQIDPEPDFEIVFELGTVMFYAHSDINFFHNSIDLFGIYHRIQYEFDGKKTFIYKAKEDKVLKGYKTLDVKPIIKKTDFLSIQSKVVDNLYNYLTNKKYYLCSINQGLNTLKIINSLHRLI